MSFFGNLFKPKYESSDRNKRIEAAEELTDEEILIKLALHDPDDTVRRIAVKNPHLTREDVLVNISYNDKDSFVRSEAVKKITDEEVLFNILQNDNSGTVCIEIAKNPNIKSQEIQCYIVQMDFMNYWYRKELINKITDEKILCEISKHSYPPTDYDRKQNQISEYSVSYLALDNVEDESLLVDIALNSDYPTISMWAAIRIKKEENLIKALASKHTKCREKVVELISNDEVLIEVSLYDESKYVRENAVKNLTDEEILTKIAKNDTSKWVRMSALRNSNLNDIDTLIEVINHDEDERVSSLAKNRMEEVLTGNNNEDELINVVNKINDENLIIKAIKNIHDENFLRQTYKRNYNQRIRNTINKILLKQHLDSSLDFTYLKKVIKNDIDSGIIKTQYEVDEKIKSFQELIDKYHSICDKNDTSKYYNDDLITFEVLNTATSSIYDLGEHEVLIILDDMTNITSWDEFESSELSYSNIIFLSEDLSKYDNLNNKYFDVNVSYDVNYADYYLEGENKRPCSVEVYSCGNSFKNVIAFVCQNLKGTVENIDYMFTACESLTTIAGLDTWDTSNLKSMNHTFAGCESLENIPYLENLNVNNLQDISYLFGRYYLSVRDFIDYNDSYVLDGVHNDCKTSFECNNIKNVAMKLDKWDTTNIVLKEGVFSGCDDIEDEII